MLGCFSSSSGTCAHLYLGPITLFAGVCLQAVFLLCVSSLRTRRGKFVSGHLAHNMGPGTEVALREQMGVLGLDG